MLDAKCWIIQEMDALRAFVIGEKQIGFNLQNNTNSGIKINWDELSFIAPNGKSMRVIHSGIRLIDRNAPQAPTIVPVNSKISDILIPSEHIYYISGEYGGWEELELFPELYKRQYEGKKFTIYFPLEIKGERKEYSFVFIINKVIRLK